MRKNAIFFTLVATLVALLHSGCSSGKSMSNATSGGTAMVNIRVSDPATCSAPQGSFSHIYVTITDVQINSSASAGDNDPGWIDLTPNLAPQQVDLLGQASNQCFLATLGVPFALQPGSYQQIRIFLAPNSTVVSPNVCGGSANCVMLSNSPTTPQPLLLSSESHTGLKIPSGQIAGGQFVIAAGQTKDLDIDFDACDSIVAEGNGQFRLKPVLHAGEVSLTSSSINGKIVDKATAQAIVGGSTIVALEQMSPSLAGGAGIDRVIMETVTDSSGNFSFCPVPAGTYDVVAVAISGAHVAYAATVITGVQPGNALGSVPLTAQTGTATAPASITGQVTTSSGSSMTSAGLSPTTADISLSALQPIGASLMATIPLAGQSASNANLTTMSSATCPAKTDCATYTLSVPALNPSIGAFSTSGTQTPVPPASGAVNYTIDARAFTTDSTATPDCTPSEIETSSTSANTPLTVTSGLTATAATVVFSGCQ